MKMTESFYVYGKFKFKQEAHPVRPINPLPKKKKKCKKNLVEIPGYTSGYKKSCIFPQKKYYNQEKTKIFNREKNDDIRNDNIKNDEALRNASYNSSYTGLHEPLQHSSSYMSKISIDPNAGTFYNGKNMFLRDFMLSF